MSKLNGKRPFVGVKYIQKATGAVSEVISVTIANVRLKNGQFEQTTSLAGFYDDFRRAPNQPSAKVRKAQVEEAEKPRVKQSEFEND